MAVFTENERVFAFRITMRLKARLANTVTARQREGRGAFGIDHARVEHATLLMLIQRHVTYELQTTEAAERAIYNGSGINVGRRRVLLKNLLTSCLG